MTILKNDSISGKHDSNLPTVSYVRFGNGRWYPHQLLAQSVAIHQLAMEHEQRGSVFFTENTSEVGDDFFHHQIAQLLGFKPHQHLFDRRRKRWIRTIAEAIDTLYGEEAPLHEVYQAWKDKQSSLRFGDASLSFNSYPPKQPPVKIWRTLEAAQNGWSVEEYEKVFEFDQPYYFLGDEIIVKEAFLGKTIMVTYTTTRWVPQPKTDVKLKPEHTGLSPYPKGRW